MARLRTPLSARGFDFLELAMAVYAADRTQRRGANGADGLCRNMAVAVAVRDPAYWNSPTINALVVTALEMVSSDAWSVEFVRRTEPTEIQRSLFDDFEKYDAVALYSAGLDSASGLAAKVQSNDGCRRITASRQALHS